MSYLYIQDPGHGWVRVSLKEIIRLGIAEKISTYSYQNGQYVYLEEDCDAGIWLNARRQHGLAPVLTSRHVERTRIRSYPAYCASTFERQQP
jgi:hypothetical protein